MSHFLCWLFGHLFVRKISGEWYVGSHCHRCSIRNPHPRHMNQMKLLMNGVPKEINADWSLRFVNENPVRPVLYYKGKRVTEAWTIKMVFDSPFDPYENANTADV